MPKRLYQTVREERATPGGRRITLEFRADDDRIPAILLLPTAAHRVPAALLVHGYSGRKEHMSDTVGEALLAQHVATLAIDLPLHGEREEAAHPGSLAMHPLDLARRWRAALVECALALGYLSARPEIDPDRLAIVGYSLGAFLSVIVAAREPRVRAVALAAGGDLPAGTPFTTLIRTAADPLRAIRQLNGRPLLMVNGKWDRIVRPEQAERLFAAAGEPKELRWWDAAHRLSPEAITDAAAWLAARLGE
jgi:dienelactone hydrolase